jgi:hypothetical protein
LFATDLLQPKQRRVPDLPVPDFAAPRQGVAFPAKHFETHPGSRSRAGTRPAVPIFVVALNFCSNPASFGLYYRVKAQHFVLAFLHCGIHLIAGC